MILENASHAWNDKEHVHSKPEKGVDGHVHTNTSVEQFASHTPAPDGRLVSLPVPMMPQGFIVTQMAPMATHAPVAVQAREPQAFITAFGAHFGHPNAAYAPYAASSQAPHQHEHTCITNLNSSSWITNAMDPKPKGPVTLFMFEFACLFHSILIGMAVGISTDEAEIQALMIAILFHQALEGMSLGCMIAQSGISKWKAAVMMLAFSLTASIGIAIGMGLENSYSDEDYTRILVSGIFLGISGGLLLYVSLFQIVAEEFSKGSNQVNWPVKIGMYVSLIAGAAAMCILAIWL
jgi:zinc transporter ZupT